MVQSNQQLFLDGGSHGRRELEIELCTVESHQFFSEIWMVLNRLGVMLLTMMVI